MFVEVHAAKDAANIKKHGISLHRFTDMDFDRAYAAVSAVQNRANETRWIFVGPIAGKLWTGVVTFRGTVTRVISLRRSNTKERRLYGA